MVDTNLHVVLHNATFAKPYSYFLTVKVDDDRDVQKNKFRTEVSTDTAQPVFKMNSFVFHVTPEIYDANPELLVEVYVVMKEGSADNTDRSEAKGAARYLGAATLPLKKLLSGLVNSDTRNTNVSENISFNRNTESQGDITVGKVTVEMFSTEPTGSTDRESSMSTPSSAGKTPQNLPTGKASKSKNTTSKSTTGNSMESLPQTSTMQHGGLAPTQLNLLTDRVGNLTSDIQNKQALIDRLLNEVDQRTDAIRMCGVEIVELRKGNKQLQQDNLDLRRRLHEGDRPIDVDQVANVALPELQKKYMTLLKEFKSECMRNEDLGSRIDVLKQDSARLEDVQRKYRELEDAHQMQNMYITNLNDKMNKIGKYRRTVKTQEKVILQLERVIEETAKDVRSLKDLKGENGELLKRIQELEEDIVKMKTVGQFGSAASIPAIIEEKDAEIIALKKRLGDSEMHSRDLERKASAATPAPAPAGTSREDKAAIDSLKAENKRLEAEVERLKAQAQKARGAKDDSAELMEMEEEIVKHMLRADQAESRVKIMDEESKKVNKKYGDEIFKLKLKIAELEAQSSMFGGPVASNIMFDEPPEDVVQNLTKTGVLSAREGGGTPTRHPSHISGRASRSVGSRTPNTSRQ